MSKKNKKPKAGVVQIKMTAIEASRIESDVNHAAGDDWLTLNVTQMAGRGTMTYHWMFDDARTGGRVLNYWPGNGKWWCPKDNSKGIASSPWEALEVARNKAPALLIGNREWNEQAEAA